MNRSRKLLPLVVAGDVGATGSAALTGNQGQGEICRGALVKEARKNLAVFDANVHTSTAPASAVRGRPGR